MIHKCKECHKKFNASPSHHRIFCSRICSDKNIIKIPLIIRFKEKYKILSNGCWEWIASKDARKYGMIHINKNKNTETHTKRAHIVSWTMLGREIPKGFELDHLCRNHSCVNPDHLECVTHKINMSRGAHARKIYCPKGHPYSKENTAIYSNRRNCRTCLRDKSRINYIKRKIEK